MKTYRAYTMAEALSAVKRDLGADASIVHTRTFKRGGILGLGRKTVVEVTASHSEIAQPSARERKAARLPAAARNAYAGAIAENVSMQGRTPDQAPAARTAKGLPATTNLEGRKHDLLAAIEHHRRTAPMAKSESVEPKAGGGGGPSLADDLRTVIAEAARLSEHAPGTSPVPNSSPSTSRTPDSSSSRSASTPSYALEQECESDDEPPQAPVSRVARRFILRDPDRAASSAGTAGCETPKRAKTTAAAKEKDRSPTLTISEAGQTAGMPGLADVPVNRRPVLTYASTGGAATEAMSSELQTKLLSAVERTNRESAAVQSEMQALRAMVSRLLEQRDDPAALPTRLFRARLTEPMQGIYAELLEQDLSETLAQRVVEGALRQIDESSAADEHALRSAVRSTLAELIATTTVRLGERSDLARPLTIALIGPTGVGKTTTVAKLAAAFQLRQGLRVGLITCDTYRIAAVDQLRTYAQIIGLPLKIALTPAEMTQHCHQLRDCDVILIDTAGRSQRDSMKLEELTRFIDAAEPHEVHLVLSATASERVLQQEVDHFSRIRTDALILTKLDEAVAYGPVVNVMRRVGKPLSFITTGQEVPDHLEPAAAARIADLIMEGDADTSQPSVHRVERRNVEVEVAELSTPDMENGTQHAAPISVGPSAVEMKPISLAPQEAADAGRDVRKPRVARRKTSELTTRGDAQVEQSPRSGTGHLAPVEDTGSCSRAVQSALPDAASSAAGDASLVERGWEGAD